MTDKTEEEAASYFGLFSIRQGMRWIQLFMIAISLMDIYPAVTEMGYECEMQFTDDSAALGTMGQLYCSAKNHPMPWTVCKMNAMETFFSEFADQIGLFFGLVLMSCPKPSISYVRIARYLVLFSMVESAVRLPYFCMAYAQGSEFTKSSSSCMFEVSAGGSDAKQLTSQALRNIIYELLSLIFYSAFIWGTYVLIPVLKRGGTGDERVAGSDVLSLVRKSPPKLLVLTSAFGIAPLRIASILLCLGLVGMCLYNGFNNILRMSSWCGVFEMESAWCRWPYGVLSLADQLGCILVSLYTTYCLVFLRPDKKFPSLSILWGYVTLSSLIFVICAAYIIINKYPAYWFSGMRSDIWIYYTRFWFGANLVVFMRSISVIRVAGGIGSEDDRDASDLIYANMSDDLDINGGMDEDDADSLADLFGKSTLVVEDIPMTSSVASSSRETSVLGTPLIPVRASQAVDGLEVQAED